MDDILKNIKECFSNDKIYYTKHAFQEMKSEEFGVIYDEDVYQAVLNSEIIEYYLDDKPYPSILLLGFTEKKRPLHVVTSYNQHENFTYVITVYHPDPSLWINFKKRKEL